MQTVSASIGIERHNPPIVEQPYQSTWPIGLSSRVKCHASQVTLGSLTTRDLLFDRPVISYFYPPLAHKGSVRMPVCLFGYSALILKLTAIDDIRKKARNPHACQSCLAHETAR